MQFIGQEERKVVGGRVSRREGKRRKDKREGVTVGKEEERREVGGRVGRREGKEG